ncbi:unnamed protein product [Bursaphelenchus okinawaensis]|uniref:Uncharacterized protein n=1 Tax=Bursaphelenchus okinawaensis TaxID=465554 RepID=A0A811LNL4_9BILA|nr:unnamed protein product [Bursaphelenchus okinawaensis]CAG9126169.1 unnamed protein product [Bursaphelenchus okinawaensis]
MDNKHGQEDDEEIQNDETSQQWLMRQLRKHLEHVPDQVLREFVHQQDITPLRNFMTGTRQRRCLFIQIEEIVTTAVDHKFFDQNPLTEVEKDEKPIEEQLSQLEVDQHIEQELTDMQTRKKSVLSTNKRKMKRFNSKKSKKIQEKETQLKPLKVPEKPVPAPNPTIEAPPVPVQSDGPEFLKAHTSYVLKWYDEENVPESKFVFMATRDEILSGTKSEFDKMFVTGYCKDLFKYGKAIEIGKLLLKNITFEHKMNLVMQLETNQTKMEKWQDPEGRFENFILESLVNAFQSSLQRMNTESMLDPSELDVESIETLLKSRVKLFALAPSKEGLTQLKFELSLLEMKYISNEMFEESVVGRIDRSSSLLSMLFMLYRDNSREWIQKTLFHCIELTARTIATNIHQRVWNLVHEDNPQCDRKISNVSDETHVNIIYNIQPLLVKLLNLGFTVLNEGSDEYICLQKIEQCIKIVNYIQEELEVFKDIYVDLKNPVRDLTFDRTALDKVQQIVTALWHSFEESYFESSLESGNYDSMKNVCLTMVQLISEMKEIMPKVDSFCQNKFN